MSEIMPDSALRGLKRQRFRPETYIWGFRTTENRPAQSGTAIPAAKTTTPTSEVPWHLNSQIDTTQSLVDNLQNLRRQLPVPSAIVAQV